jgi:thiamine biosynthesis lipoprotein
LDQVVTLKPPYPAPASPKQFAVPPGMGRAQFHAMGTTVSVLLPNAVLQVGAAATRELFAQWEQTLSRFLPESELSRLNRQAGKSMHVSDLLFRVVRAAITAAEETEGLFDPTLLLQLIQLGYDRSFDDLPSTVAASERPALPGGGWRNVRLDSMRHRVTLPANVGIEVGGIAKGMAVDAALAQLRLLGLSTALVNAGGDLAVMGLPPSYDSWPLAIEGKTTSWEIPLRSGALATSGIARRHWQQGARTRHHLIDPRSGESAQSGLWSVTTVAESCQQAEVAAKVAFLLGSEGGRDFLRQRGLAGLLVQHDGSWISAGPWPTELMRESNARS